MGGEKGGENLETFETQLLTQKRFRPIKFQFSFERKFLKLEALFYI